jgi:hypothetical protein
MLPNALDQMLIEGTPFEAGHGKRCGRTPSALTDIEFGERGRTQTGIELKVASGW